MPEKNIYLRVKTFGKDHATIHRVEDMQDIVAQVNKAAEERDGTFKVTIEFVFMTEQEFNALEEA